MCVCVCMLLGGHQRQLDNRLARPRTCSPRQPTRPSGGWCVAWVVFESYSLFLWAMLCVLNRPTCKKQVEHQLTGAAGGRGGMGR